MGGYENAHAVRAGSLYIPGCVREKLAAGAGCGDRRSACRWHVGAAADGADRASGAGGGTDTAGAARAGGISESGL